MCPLLHPVDQGCWLGVTFHTRARVLEQLSRLLLGREARSRKQVLLSAHEAARATRFPLLEAVRCRNG